MPYVIKEIKERYSSYADSMKNIENVNAVAMREQFLEQLGQLDIGTKLSIPPNEIVCEEVKVYSETEGSRGNRQEEVLVWYPRPRRAGDYDDEATVACGPLPYYNIQDLLARFFIQTHASYGVIKNWRENIIGVTSYYSGGKHKFGTSHMPMLDYDGKNVKKIIRKDVKLLQKECGMGDAWVYETRRGFHVYFFTDVVSWDEFQKMLKKVQCCKGFKRAVLNRGYAVLRVGAKYTDFDIKLLYVLEARRKELRRMGQKAHTIRALIELGQKCGTHLASMYPQWAHFKQDGREWKVAGKRPVAKRIKKAPKPKKGLSPEEALGHISNAKQEYVITSSTTSTGHSINFTTDNNIMNTMWYK